jgi:hypothetical protein
MQQPPLFDKPPLFNQSVGQFPLIHQQNSKHVGPQFARYPDFVGHGCYGNAVQNVGATWSIRKERREIVNLGHKARRNIDPYNRILIPDIGQNRVAVKGIPFQFIDPFKSLSLLHVLSLKRYSHLACLLKQGSN